MNIFALPGINFITKRWATNLLNELVGQDPTMTVQPYNHWDCDIVGSCASLRGKSPRAADGRTG